MAIVLVLIGVGASTGLFILGIRILINLVRYWTSGIVTEAEVVREEHVLDDGGTEVRLQIRFLDTHNRSHEVVYWYGIGIGLPWRRGAQRVMIRYLPDAPDKVILQQSLLQEVIGGMLLSAIGVGIAALVVKLLWTWP